MRARYGFPPIARRSLTDRRPTPSFADSLRTLKQRYQDELAKREREYREQAALKSQLSARSLTSTPPRAKKMGDLRK